MSLLHQGPGMFFLFAAFVLLIFVSVSSPVWNSVYFLKANLGNGGSLRFGNWGYCIMTAGQRVCTAKRLGYHAEDAVRTLAGNPDLTISSSVMHGLTYALVLHPIAAAITLIAMIISLTNVVILDILGSLVAAFAFLVCLVALVIDSVLFVTARHKINDNVTGSPASLSNAYWLVVAATISLLLATFTVCFGSMHSRRQKRRDREALSTGPVMTEPKRHFWQRRRY